MNFCPNINTPEAKALINKLGLLGFYKAYIQNNFNIPSMESIEAIPNMVDGLPKVVGIFNKNQSKLNQWFNNKAVTKDVFWKKFQELGVPKDQLELLKNTEGESLDEIILNFISNYSYTVEINTAKTSKQLGSHYVRDLSQDEFEDRKGWGVFHRITGEELGVYSTEKDAWEAAHDSNNIVQENAQHYSSLTVPGGTNYSEQEIAIPVITPSIKGHAQFATDNGIGWFRSDDKAANKELIEGGIGDDGFPTGVGFNNEYRYSGSTKTRRILEIQSDWGQKQRKSSEPDINVKYDIQQIINDLQKSGDLKIDCN